MTAHRVADSSLRRLVCDYYGLAQHVYGKEIVPAAFRDTVAALRVMDISTSVIIDHRVAEIIVKYDPLSSAIENLRFGLRRSADGRASC